MQKHDPAPHRHFIHKFNTLSDTLVHDTFANINNLTHSTHHSSEALSQLQAVFRKVMAQCKSLHARTIALEQELARISPKNPLLAQRTNPELNFGDAGLRLCGLAPPKSKKAANFSKKLQTPVESSHPKKPKQLNEKVLMKEQFTQIEQFISKHLVSTLQADRSKKKCIPKNMIMNLYLRWSEAKGRTILIDKAKIIKTHITEELKKQFPYMDHNQNNYRGITFKEHIVKTPPTEPIHQEDFNEDLDSCYFEHEPLFHEDEDINFNDLECDL